MRIYFHTLVKASNYSKTQATVFNCGRQVERIDAYKHALKNKLTDLFESYREETRHCN